MSTTTTMLQLADAIMQATDANLISTIITIDESAAFDCVNYKILDQKLQLYNFDSNARTWIANYLNNRRQFVTIGAKNSQIDSVDRGVPQGSVLGPLLYTLYINELPEVMRNEECTEEAHANNYRTIWQEL